MFVVWKHMKYPRGGLIVQYGFLIVTNYRVFIVAFQEQLQKGLTGIVYSWETCIYKSQRHASIAATCNLPVDGERWFKNVALIVEDIYLF